MAEEFTKAGSEVTVITETPGEEQYEYRIVRRPTRSTIRRLGREADIVFQSNISLNTLVPLLFTKKNIVIAHHTWLTRPNGRISWQDRLKRFVIRFCKNIAISKAIAAALPVKSLLIGNPFEISEFSPYRQLPKTKDIVFVGRLVSDKGCDLAIEALAQLKAEGITPGFTIIGEGPERLALEAQVDKLGLSDQVTFLGSITVGRGKRIAEHKIILIPSRWEEPFGLVALEGIASGCVPIASAKGGLGEAVNSCGILFPNGDISALASAIKLLLTDPIQLEQYVSRADQHLEQFRPDVVARHYLDFFQHLIDGSQTKL
nr:glycosyltransferase family 4 protein [Granulicella sp. dw_53]